MKWFSINNWWNGGGIHWQDLPDTLVFQSFSKKWSLIMESYVSEKSTKQVYRYIQAKSSRIQKLGKRYKGFTNQQNLLSHKWFKNTTILITSFEHVFMVKPLINEILLSCHKRHQIFQASKGFSGRFNKHG